MLYYIFIRAYSLSFFLLGIITLHSVCSYYTATPCVYLLEKCGRKFMYYLILIDMTYILNKRFKQYVYLE